MDQANWSWLRIVRLVSFSFPYGTYVDQFYSLNPRLANASFDAQLAALEADRFPGASDALASHLEPFGFEVSCYAPTVLPLQRAWAIEQGLNFHRSDWNLHVARRQVLRDRPHVLIIDPYAVPTSWLREVREDCSSIRIVMTRYSSPKDDLSRYRSCDLVVSGDRYQVSALRSIDVNAVHLHHGFDDRVSRALQPRSPDEVVFFAGQIHIAEGFHLYRAEVIDRLVTSHVPLRLHVPSDRSGFRGVVLPYLRRTLWKLYRQRHPTSIQQFFLKSFPLLNRVKDWTHPPAKPLPRRIRKQLAPPLFGMSMYSQMRQSRVSLNTHGDVSQQEANNLRLWEATGVGSCLLTDAKANLSELFEVDAEVVTYESAEDCREKARWLLDHPQQSEEIARCGHRRVMRDHTLAHRAQEVSSLLAETM